MNKGCNKCGVELDENNWFPSHQKTKSYICSDCHRERCKPYKNNSKNKSTNPDTLDKDCRVCNTKLVVGDNFSLYKFKKWMWVCTSCESTQSSINSKKRWSKRKTQSKPGVYMIFEDNILVYIGESAAVFNRIWNHFHTSPKSKSAVGVDKKNKDRYECIQICVEDNLHKRLARELELIAVYKPKYNSPYKNIYVDNPLIYPLVDGEILLKKRVLESLDFDTFAINGF